jgi:hypothetical protein
MDERQAIRLDVRIRTLLSSPKQGRGRYGQGVFLLGTPSCIVFRHSRTELTRALPACRLGNWKSAPAEAGEAVSLRANYSAGMIVVKTGEPRPYYVNLRDIPAS